MEKTSARHENMQIHIIASLHYNLNLHREVRKKPDGSDQVQVVWPKFKNGEASVRDVRVKPHYGKPSKGIVLDYWKTSESDYEFTFTVNHS